LKETTMFGKGKSKMGATGKFVMAAGRSAGNLKAPVVGSLSKAKSVPASPVYKTRTVNKAPGVVQK
jgi:hypothetical protein